jgi:hypothetical protein
MSIHTEMDFAGEAPRECPNHSSVTPSFFCRRKYLSGAGGTSLRLHVGRDKRGAVPIDVARRIRSRLHNLEKTMPCAIDDQRTNLSLQVCQGP